MPIIVRSPRGLVRTMPAKGRAETAAAAALRDDDGDRKARALSCGLREVVGLCAVVEAGDVRLVAPARGALRLQADVAEAVRARDHVIELAERRPRAEHRLDLADLLCRGALDRREETGPLRLGLHRDRGRVRVEAAQRRLPDVAALLHGL